MDKNLIRNEIEINKSRFLGYYYKITNPTQVKSVIDNLKSEHKKATHFCYAYVCKTNGVFEKCFDDKEPSGTAGKPILNVLQKKGAIDCLVVVVRYFGGVKLGAGGLVRAYTKCASELLKLVEGE